MRLDATFLAHERVLAPTELAMEPEGQAMRTYSYGAVFEPGDEGGVVVTFPDMPEAITQGRDEADARHMAADALATILLDHLREGRPLPMPEAAGPGLQWISVDPDDAAKIALIEAFRVAGISTSELARRLGKAEREVRRMLDPAHATKVSSLSAALFALGRRLVVGVESVPA